MDTPESTLGNAQPATSGADISDGDLLKMAQQSDAGTLEETPADKPAPDAGKPAAASQEDGKPPADGSDAKNGKGEKPEAKPADKDKTTDKPPEKPADGGKETSFQKAKADAERRDRSWKALEQEKSEFRAQKAQTDIELKELRAKVAAISQAPAGPVKDEHGATAENYDAIAEKAKEEGNDVMAAAATKRAEALRAKAQQTASAPGVGSFESPAFQAKWQENVNAMIKADPDLADPQHVKTKVINQLISNPAYKPFFQAHPDGIKMAGEVAGLMREAANAQTLRGKHKELEAELATSKAEVARLSGLLQPQGGPPGAPPAGKKSIADMSDSESDAELLRLAREHDRGNTS